MVVTFKEQILAQMMKNWRIHVNNCCFCTSIYLVLLDLEAIHITSKTHQYTGLNISTGHRTMSCKKLSYVRQPLLHN